jgi:hypothetical protein
MDRDDVLAKARELMTPHIGARRVQRVIDLVWSVDKAPNVNPLVDAIAT